MVLEEGRIVFFKECKARVEKIRDGMNAVCITLLEGPWENIALWVGRKALKKKRKKYKNKNKDKNKDKGKGKGKDKGKDKDKDKDKDDQQLIL